MSSPIRNPKSASRPAQTTSSASASASAAERTAPRPAGVTHAPYYPRKRRRAIASGDLSAMAHLLS